MPVACWTMIYYHPLLILLSFPQHRAPTLFSLFQVIRHFDGCKADLVVCDGAPDGKTAFTVLTLFFMVQYVFTDILHVCFSCLNFAFAFCCSALQ